MHNKAVFIFAFKLSDFHAAECDFWPSEFNENKSHMMQHWGHFFLQVTKSRHPQKMILPLALQESISPKLMGAQFQTEKILSKEQ